MFNLHNINKLSRFKNNRGETWVKMEELFSIGPKFGARAIALAPFG